MSERTDRAQAIINRLLAEDQEPPSGGWRADMRRLWTQYLRPFRLRFVAALIIGMVWALQPFAFAMTWRFLVDGTLVPAAGRDSLGPRGVGLFCLFNTGIWTLHFVFAYTRAWLLNTTSLSVVQALRRDLHNKLAELHVGFFDRTPVGRLISRILDDVNVMQQTADNLLVHLLSEGVKLLYGPLLLLYLDWRLALAVIAVLPVFGLAFLLLRVRIKRAHMALRRLNSRTYALAGERVAGVRVVQAFVREAGEARTLARLQAESVRVALRVIHYEQGLGAVQQAITVVTTAAVAYAGATAVQDGTLSLGDLVAFLSATASVFGPVNNVISYLIQAQSAQVVVRRVFGLLDEPVDVRSGRLRLDGMQGRIEFEHVTFQYPGQQRPALADVSFQVRPGEKVALMGPSGSGKSTLFRLLLRFYDPQQGEVRVGGVDLVEAEVDSLRRHVCMVPQEPMIFSGTIAENITYGRANATPVEVARAAQAADLHDFVLSQPFVYHTEVGEGGLALSGGQRQRLALATALLTEPEVLLLDDTTSALDSATEARIRETLRHALRNRTSLFITQRVMTARDCDRIIVLARGRVAQSGTHAELSAIPGFYRAVCEQQGQLG